MGWRVRFRDVDYSSDDLTMGELEQVETITGEPWSMLNPVRNVKGARALLVIGVLRGGGTAEDAADLVDTLTVADIREVFSWEDSADDQEGGDGAVPLEATSPASRTGRRAATGGGRRKSAKSA